MNPYTQCYIEKSGEKWFIRYPDGSNAWFGSFTNKGWATKTLNELIRDPKAYWTPKQGEVE